MTLNWPSFARSLLCALAVPLAGCVSVGPAFNADSVSDELNRISCKKLGSAAQNCERAYNGKSDLDPDARALRLLRAYLLLESAARFGAARFSVYSDAPGDDAFQLMGAVALAVEALEDAERERLGTGNAREVAASQLYYPVDRSVALFRLIAVLDSASKPVRRGITGMLMLNSNAGRVKDAVGILRRAAEDAVFAEAYQQAAGNLYLMQANGRVPFNYDEIKVVVLARLDARCADLGNLANQRNGEHNCGKSVKDAGGALKGGVPGAAPPAAKATNAVSANAFER